MLCHAQQNDDQSPLPTYVWQNVGNPGFSPNPAGWMSFAFNPVNNQPYVAYGDGVSSGKAIVMRFDGTNWVLVGPPDFSAGTAQFISIAISPSGQPYVAYDDWGYSKRATVMKFDGTNWIYVGSPGFSVQDALQMSLAFSPSGVPYVAYMDGAYNYRAVVRKFDGTSWVNIGSPGFSSNASEWIHIAINPVTQQPYVAYANYGGTLVLFANVKKFDGTSWVYVGNPNFSTGSSYYTCITFSPAGEPYVAFHDGYYGMKARVMRFNGTSWTDVGNPGFSAGLADFIRLAFNPVDGLPYLAFKDILPNNARKASLMKFDGSNWVYVGNGDFSTGVDYLDFGFSPSGIPYISYEDSVYSGRATVMKYDSCNTQIPTIAGQGNLCVNSGYYNYSTEPGKSSYQWTISPGGTITYGQGSNMAQVVWGQAGNQWISVSYMNSYGCISATKTLPVTVVPLPDPAGAITGPPVVCAGSEDIEYSVLPVANTYTYIWTLPSGASITSGDGTNSIGVAFSGNAASGNTTVYGNNVCGNGATSPPFYVTVNPIPATPLISEQGDTLTSSAPTGNQWFYNGTLLVNDTSRTYLVNPGFPGSYWTKVTLNNCASDTSNHIYYTTTGLNKIDKPGITIFPDPASTNLLIEIAGGKGPIKYVEIYELTGARVFETQSDKNRIVVNVETYLDGIYIIKVKTETSFWTGKFCKD